MQHLLIAALVALCALPSVALAGEPSRGTVVTVASIGLWVILSSASLVIRRQRDARISEEEAKKKLPTESQS